MALNEAKESYKLNECNIQENYDPIIYIPKLIETYIDKENQIRKIEVGQRNVNASEKVVLVVGATGAGKSSLINMVFNHIVGVGMGG